jgi:hypothetical protein
MPIMNVDKYKAALTQLMSDATGEAASAFDDFANDNGPLLAKMAAQGATEDDFAEYAEASFGELCIRGINVQAALERAGKTVAQLFVAAGKVALGLV